MQQPALRAVRKPLIDRQIRSQHNSHQVRAMEQPFCFERAMEIASQMEEPTAPRLSSVSKLLSCLSTSSGREYLRMCFNFIRKLVQI